MLTPIDLQNFNALLGDKTPVGCIDFDSNLIPGDGGWEYYLADGKPIIVYRDFDKALIFEDPTYPTGPFDNANWNVEYLGNAEKPKEAILNHILRGNPLSENLGGTELRQGYYRITNTEFTFNQVIYLLCHEWEWSDTSEFFVWWPGKCSSITSLPLINEMIDFYNTILYGKEIKEINKER